jgi:hypothetical protein
MATSVARAWPARLAVPALLLVLAGATAAQPAVGDADAATRAVWAMGGTTVRDYDAPGRPVVGVNLAAGDGTDAQLKALADLDGLGDVRELNLRHTPVTAAGLRELGRLPRLEKLNLADTPAGDAELTAAAGLPALRYVDVSRTKVTEEAKDAVRKARPDLSVFP